MIIGVNVGKYSIHGASGYSSIILSKFSFLLPEGKTQGSTGSLTRVSAVHFVDFLEHDCSKQYCVDEFGSWIYVPVGSELEFNGL